MNLPLSSFSRFRPDVQRLLIVSGLMSISFFGIQALLKVLYVLRLGHGPEFLGVFNASGAFSYMLASLPAGVLGERLGLLRAMRWGGFCVIVSMVMLPMTEMLPSSWQLAWPILSQVMGTVGWALFGINLVPAFMTASTPENRNNVYAFSAVLRSLGTLVGTVVGGVLPGLFASLLGETTGDPGPYRWGLWISALVSAIAVYFLFRIRELPNAGSTDSAQGNGRFPLGAVSLTVLHVYLINAAWATCQSFCNAYMDTDLRLSPAMIGLIVGMGQTVAVFVPLWTPRLAARHGNGWLLMVAGGATGVILLPLAFLHHALGAGIGSAGVVAMVGLWMPAFQVYQMEKMERHWRSLAYGISSMAMGLSFGTVSLIGGYFAARWGYTNLFLIGVVLAFTGSVLMWGILKRPAQIVALQKE
ncbi:MFS transporter [bacterium]|nr:MFS transporter [bacterium]